MRAQGFLWFRELIDDSDPEFPEIALVDIMRDCLFCKPCMVQSNCSWLLDPDHLSLIRTCIYFIERGV